MIPCVGQCPKENSLFCNDTTTQCNNFNMKDRTHVYSSIVNMEKSVKKKVICLRKMLKCCMITNSPAQPREASFEIGRSSGKTMTTTNQITPRWTKSKVVDFQVLRVDLDKWREESKKAAALSSFFAVTFSLVARRLQFLSRRRSWAEDKWSAESGQEPVG